MRVHGYRLDARGRVAELLVGDAARPCARVELGVAALDPEALAGLAATAVERDGLVRTAGETEIAIRYHGEPARATRTTAAGQPEEPHDERAAERADERADERGAGRGPAIRAVGEDHRTVEITWADGRTATVRYTGGQLRVRVAGARTRIDRHFGGGSEGQRAIAMLELVD
jgi:hypothetical protein